ncbi:MAG: DUF4248 domain-containing protein [Chlorobi bacterium]|nr:DUF4248 domain-containing protein [Chlorobiota bacterium]
MIFKQTKTKIEVAMMLNISPATLRKWLNIRYYDELAKLDYSKNQQILTPKQLNFLAEKVDLSPLNP